MKTILKLHDAASDADIEAAVQTLQQENESLTQANTALADEIKRLKTEADEAAQQRQQEQKDEAVKLVDAAVRDGRLHANGKDAFLALFDADFGKAKATLEAIPKVKRVTEQIEAEAVELKDLAAKSWDQLDREDLLVKLRDLSPELYAQKYKEKFGNLSK